jgi:hypothetical protein
MEPTPYSGLINGFMGSALVIWHLTSLPWFSKGRSTNVQFKRPSLVTLGSQISKEV